MTERELDLVLYGASGFTGQEAAAYLARQAPISGVRWGLAGRNLDKLKRVREALGEVARAIPLLIAESSDQIALEALAARTRVIASTAGPYAKYGHGMVAACVRQRTHYADITGETPWVREIIDRHHAHATATATRIVPCCGFDSVPADLGAYLINQHAREMQHAEGLAVQAFYRLRGGINGGTLATLWHLRDTGTVRQLNDAYLLCPNVARPAASAQSGRHGTFWPRYDRQAGVWVGPFFMGPINRQVVLRSAHLLQQQGGGYGPDFKYREWLCYGRRFGWLRGVAMHTAMGLFFAALATPLSKVVRARLPQPGAGPTAAQRENGYLRCDMRGETGDGHRVLLRISDSGDPGNRITVKCLIEAALCLAVDSRRLPGGTDYGGVLTPATAMGEVLVKRLRASGMCIALM